MPSPEPDPLEPAWQALLCEWEHDERHRAFVGLAATLERLPDAARRYRAELAHSARGPRAKQGLDLVLGVAMSSLTPLKRPERPPINLMLPMGAFAAALIMTVFLAQATGFRSLTSPWVIFGEALVMALIPWRRIRGG
jgi:hypothetical protein